MNIEILQLIEGARQAKGLAVIIDVFRAFSLACYAFDQGAREIIPVGDIEIAYKLKSQHPDIILVGERNERKPDGFDYGNSPAMIKDIDFTGKTVAHSTSAGTQGLVNAKSADEIITGSFVNANAISRYIKSKKPAIVSLVCMGYASLYPTEEDTLCAEYIRNTLMDFPNNMEEISEKIRKTSGQRLFDPLNQTHSPKEDFYLCTDLGRFNFVLKAEYAEDGLIRLRKIEC
jgi:Phosphosulfolactate phosphohydrolase and related enzymes